MSFTNDQIKLKNSNELTSSTHICDIIKTSPKTKKIIHESGEKIKFLNHEERPITGCGNTSITFNELIEKELANNNKNIDKNASEMDKKHKFLKRNVFKSVPLKE